jgi:fructose-specific phosphotransferase system IIC component
MSAPAANPILTTSLRWGGLFALGLAIVAGTVGYLVAGLPGLWGGLLGAGLAFVFLGLTADDPGSPLFFGVVLGAWLLKLIVFFIFMFWLRGQDWLDPWVFFLSVIVAVLGSLVVDVIAFQRSRTPYVDVALPGDEDGEN